MNNMESLEEIKEYINQNIGNEVSLVTDRGKRRMKERNGTVKNTFRNIFTVEITEGFNNTRTVSFSYSDVLTKDVEFIVSDIPDEKQLEEKIDVL